MDKFIVMKEMSWMDVCIKEEEVVMFFMLFFLSVFFFVLLIRFIEEMVICLYGVVIFVKEILKWLEEVFEFKVLIVDLSLLG